MKNVNKCMTDYASMHEYAETYVEYRTIFTKVTKDQEPMSYAQ